MNAGKGWATTGFLLGVAVSVAGNVAHTWHPSTAVLASAGKTADQWRPELGAQLVAAFFPMALLVVVEILARVKWPQTLGWSAARYGGATLVAGVAAIVSYLHLRGLLIAYGEDGVTSLIGPLSVDGLMVVSGFALIAIGRTASLEAREFETDNLAVSNTQSVTEVPEGPRSVVEDEMGTREVSTPGGHPRSAVVGPVEIQAPDPAGFDQPIDQADEGSAAGGDRFDVVESAVLSAKANKVPIKSIAEQLGITQYRVKKILGTSSGPDPELVSTSHNGYSHNLTDE